ncbi:hypothetical protein AgCh_031279 [Apium graveolens]
MARLQQTQRKRVGSVLCLPVDVVAAIAAENEMRYCPASEVPCSNNQVPNSYEVARPPLSGKQKSDQNANTKNPTLLLVAWFNKNSNVNTLEDSLKEVDSPKALRKAAKGHST